VPPGKSPKFTIPELERQARRLLADRFPDGVAIPVDIDFLVESEPGVTLDTLGGLRSQFGIAGVTLAHPAEKRFTVIIDHRVADGLPAFSRFTVAEEFAHLTLHRSLLVGVKTVEDAVRLHESPAYYRDYERNAKWFASAILMPEDLLREDARTIFAGLRVTVRDEGVLRNRLTIRLAQRFNVSESAMRYRLQRWPLKTYDAIRQAFERGLAALP